MSRTKSLVILLALGLLIGSTVLSAPKQKDVDRASVAKNLEALKKERRDLLVQALRDVEAVYKQGENMYLDVAPVLMNWRDAELDLAPDRAARIKLRELILERYKEVEDMVAERAKRSQVEVNVLEAKAARLQAEIDLLREQSTD
jgi:hypothetical protein